MRPAIEALPSWTDEAPVTPLLSYDALFASTQRALAFHAEDAPALSPSIDEVVRQPSAAEDVPLPSAAEVEPPTLIAEVVPLSLPLPLPPPRTRPRPRSLRLSSGETVSLDRGVLLGRAPKANKDLRGTDRPRLLRLASHADLSRNHAEVVVDGLDVMVRDLGSTNGTTVTLPGEEPTWLRPGDLRALPPGAVVTMADEVSFTFETGA